MSLFSEIGKIKSIWATVAAVFPALETFVQQVESAFPAGTAGSAKLAQVKAFLSAAWATISGIETDLETAWPTISALIGALVTMYNTSGLFKHKSS